MEEQHFQYLVLHLFTCGLGGNFRCKLDCKLVESSCILLGRKACVGMNIVSYLDNDAINPPAPSTTKHTVYTVGTTPEPVETLNKRYPTVFTEGVGRLEGQYHIRLNLNVEPVQHAPRRVPIAVCKQLRSTLDQLDILTPAIKPTPWINSLTIVPKKNGTLHLCLDPKDFNKAILRENYSLPTIEDVATKLHGAKVSCGFS